MHLADGIVSSPGLIVGLDLIGAGGVATALARVSRAQTASLTYAGTLAAFVLALQAINIPLVPGASAHVIGAGLLTLAVGPARAIVAMTAVLLVQALALADGGLSVLGINALNIAVIPSLAVHACRCSLPDSNWGLATAATVGTALGSVLGAISLTATLVAGANAPAALTAAWLVGAQGLAGLAEGGLTALAVVKLRQRAPDLLARTEPSPPRPWRALGWGLVVLLALVPFASDLPDALEVVTHHLQGSR